MDAIVNVFLQIGGRIFEKMERAKVISTGLLNDLKIRVEVEISNAPYDME